MTTAAVRRFLGGGAGVDGGLQAFLGTESFPELHVQPGSWAVGGATLIGEDVTLPEVGATKFTILRPAERPSEWLEIEPQTITAKVLRKFGL